MGRFRLLPAAVGTPEDKWVNLRVSYFDCFVPIVGPYQRRHVTQVQGEEECPGEGSQKRKDLESSDRLAQGDEGVLVNDEGPASGHHVAQNHVSLV